MRLKMFLIRNCFVFAILCVICIHSEDIDVNTSPSVEENGADDVYTTPADAIIPENEESNSKGGDNEESAEGSEEKEDNEVGNENKDQGEVNPEMTSSPEKSATEARSSAESVSERQEAETTTAAKSESTSNQEILSVTTTTLAPSATELVKEKAPESTFAVWDSKGKICLLAKFHAEFAITYPSRGGEQSASVKLPDKIDSKGKCSTDVKSRELQLFWNEFLFTLTFSKIQKKDEEEWAVTGLELRYDTLAALFDGATNGGKQTVRSKDVELFKTDCGKSYTCPLTEVIHLYKPSTNKKVATVQMRDVQFQPFEVKDGTFSEAKECSEVGAGEQKEAFRDETAPLAVGLTLTILTLIVVLGFAVHRAYMMRKVDYDGME